MRREVTAAVTAALVVLAEAAPLPAYTRGGGRGSVSAASRGSYSKSGNTGSWQGQHASGSRSVSQTGEGYNVNKQVQTQSGASKSVNKDINTQDPSVERSSTATNAWGQSASRERQVEGQGGYATIEGSAKTSTGREASGEAVAGRNMYGQPVVAGSVNTKYNGSYAGAAAKNPYGGWNSATVGPYGGKVTTTLPSGYKTSTYYGRPYYSYGGAYYRPYTYGGVPYYYPVPPPYYSSYSSPPPGAVMLMVAGVAYLASQDGSYSKQTTSSQGQVVYQTVPAPEGAKLTTLPAQRVLVTVAGSTYYLYSNAFYRRVVSGGQETFVVVTPPAGVVFVPSLPADFQVVQLNTMYFAAQGGYYVPFLSTDGKELYVLVDPPPQPPATAATAAPVVPGAPAPAAATPAPVPVAAVAESIVVPAETVLVVRLASDVSSASAKAGDRFQGFLDADLSAGGRFVAPRGARVYGVVASADPGNKTRGKPSLSVTLTDLQVGERAVPIQTRPISVEGQALHGGKKVAQAASLGSKIGEAADPWDGASTGAKAGAAVGLAAVAKSSPDAATLPAQSQQVFTVAAPFKVDVMTSVAVR